MAHDAVELLFDAPNAPVICINFVKYAEHNMLPHFVKYVESQSRSDCCEVTVAKRLFPNFVKYAEPRREATVTPRRRSEAAS